MPSENFDSDVAMFQAAESIRLRPDMRDPWLAYQRAVESYSDKLLTNESDALDAFTGILRTIFGTRHIQGLPVAMLDHALLWQPDGRHYRRSGFASWSWIGWSGRVRWLRNLQSELKDVGPEVRTWIAWYSSSDANYDTSALLADESSRLRCQTVTNNARSKLFVGEPQIQLPTPALLQNMPQYDARRVQQRLHYLQFWTFVMRAKIILDPLAVLKSSSLQAENTGNGLRKFIVFAEQSRNCGWVLLDQSWTEKLCTQPGESQDFILLSEVDSCDASYSGNVFNAMMLVRTDGVMKRAGLGQIFDEAIGSTDVEWKEIILA